MGRNERHGGLLTVIVWLAMGLPASLGCTWILCELGFAFAAIPAVAVIEGVTLWSGALCVSSGRAADQEAL